MLIGPYIFQVVEEGYYDHKYEIRLAVDPVKQLITFNFACIIIFF